MHLLLRTAAIATGTLLLSQLPRFRSEEVRPGHIGEVEGVAFSASGALLATADNDGRLVVTRVQTRKPIATLAGRNFTEVAFSPDQTFLAAGGFDSLVYVWRAPYRRQPRLLRYGGAVEALAIDKFGVVYAAGGGERIIRRWQLPALEALAPLRGHSDDIYTVRPSPNDRWIASAGRDREIRIWNLRTGKLERVLTRHKDSVYDVAFDSASTVLAAALRDGTVALWSTATWTLIRHLTGPKNSIHGVVFSPDNEYVVGAGFDGNVWVWQITGRAEGFALRGHRRKVAAVAFSRDGLLASVASDTAVRLWRR